MIRTGSLLKQQREQKKMSIPEVSLATKINPRILQAIEEGNTSQLPQRSYLRGFVRSYASYLRADVNKVLETFNEEMGGATPTSLAALKDLTSLQEKKNGAAGAPKTAATYIPEPEDVEPEPAPVKPPPPVKEEKREEKKVAKPEPKPAPAPTPAASSSESSFTLKTLSHLPTFSGTSKGLIIAAVAVLISVIMLVKNIVDKYEKEKELPSQPIEVAELPAPAQSTDKDKVTAKPAEKKAETATAEKPADKPADKKPEAVAAATTTTPPAVTPPAVTPPPPPVVETKPAEKPAEAKPVEKVETKKEEKKPEVAAAPSGAPQTILIEALDKVSISFKIDGGDSQRVSLSPEEVHTIKAKSSVTMDISDGGALNITQNGKDRGVPGDLGKPVKVKFP